MILESLRRYLSPLLYVYAGSTTCGVGISIPSPTELLLSLQTSCTIGQLLVLSTDPQRPAPTQRAPAIAPMLLPARLCTPASRGLLKGSPLAASLPSTPPARKRSMCGPGGAANFQISAILPSQQLKHSRFGVLSAVQAFWYGEQWCTPVRPSSSDVDQSSAACPLICF